MILWGPTHKRRMLFLELFLFIFLYNSRIDEPLCCEISLTEECIFRLLVFIPYVVVSILVATLTIQWHIDIETNNSLNLRSYSNKDAGSCYSNAQSKYRKWWNKYMLLSDMYVCEFRVSNNQKWFIQIKWSDSRIVMSDSFDKIWITVCGWYWSSIY